MTSSDFVGCQTGILTGFSPFRILPGHRKCIASDQQRNLASRQHGSRRPEWAIFLLRTDERRAEFA
jgi:hypothetical protein